jgi:hypothetical protein
MSTIENPSSAADRFRAAAVDRNIPAAAHEFADDIKLFTPASPDPIVGRDEVAAALGRLESIFETFEYSHVVVDRDPPAPGVSEVQATVFRATFGDHVLEGVDLFEVSDDDRIGTFTVFARPVSAVLALGQAMAGRQAGA